MEIMRIGMKKLVSYALIISMIIALVGCDNSIQQLEKDSSLVDKGLFDETLESTAEAQAAYITKANEYLANNSFDEFDIILPKINDASTKQQLEEEKIKSLTDIQNKYLLSSIGIIIEDDNSTDYESIHIVAITQDGKVLLSNAENTKIEGDSVERKSIDNPDGSEGTLVTQTRALSYIADWNNVVSIETQDSYILGLTTEGTALTAGSDLDGANAIDPFMGSESVWYNEVRNNKKLIASISAGNSHSLAVTTDNEVLTCGFQFPFNAYPDKYEWDKIPVSAFDWKDIIAVAAGLDHSIGLKTDGTAVSCGSNYSKQGNVGSWTNIVSIKAGNSFTVGLRYDGTIVFTGNNMNFNKDSIVVDFNSWKDIIKIEAGLKIIAGIKNDGTVLLTGDGSDKFEDVKSWANIVDIAVTEGGIVGLKSDGTLISTFDNQEEIENWTDIMIN